MISLLRQFAAKGEPEVRQRIVRMMAFVIAVNAVLWGLTLVVSTRYSIVLSVGLLAYTFGLRHGVDADHISAIDNVTRKLMQNGKRPVGVGLFFSLGHSTVVLILSACVVVASAVVQQSMPGLQGMGGLIGTSVSAIFLYSVGLINLLVLIEIVQMFRRVTRGEVYREEMLDASLGQLGLMNRFFRPIVRMIDSSWKMYPLGLLFGLGFDTATEVALLGISTTTVGEGMPVIIVVLFPLLFAAGMSLVDTLDSILMVGAYGWASVTPVRKLYYNLNLTLISVLAALVVGTMELLQVLSERFGFRGGVWSQVAGLDFERIGYAIIAIFVLSWAGSTMFYKLKRYDAIEATLPPVSMDGRALS